MATTAASPHDHPTDPGLTIVHHFSKLKTRGGGIVASIIFRTSLSSPFVP